MKRTNSESSNPQKSRSQSGGGGGLSQGSNGKKLRTEDDEFTFEEELMRMDENMIDIDESEDENQEKRWARPKTELDVSQPLIFQWLDIDMSSIHLEDEDSNGAIPVVRLYGVTSQGSSVMATIHGFDPYFYVMLPQNCNPDLEHFKNALESRMREKVRGDEKKVKRLVLDVLPITDHSSIFFYQFDVKKTFLKIVLAMPSLVPNAKRILEESGLSVSDMNGGGGGTMRFQSFESNVPYVLRFMIDHNIAGAGWVELLGGTYTLKSDREMTTRCSYEVSVSCSDLLAHESNGPYSAIAPLKILSFDIECMGRKGHFPDAQFDPVIQIANTITLQGSSVPIVRNVFTLNSCLPIVGADVRSFDSEEEMLLKWREFVNQCDPDIITGYNIANFDIPYLLNRAKALEKASPSASSSSSSKKKATSRLKIFPDLGRIRGMPAIMRDTTFQSSAFGKRENIETSINGRVIFDVLQYMFRNHKLSSYSLNSVSKELLGQQKEDVHHSIISDLQMGDAADRRRLAVYCLKDAYLPQQLMNKLAIVVNYVEMARVTGVPLNFLLTRGQQIKVFSMLLRKTRREKLLIPNLPRHSSDDSTYEGATVIDPRKAYYEVPIATLDFASLYPSIMQGYNLCYSTLVRGEDVSRLSPEAYARSPTNHVFVTEKTKKGILPQILDELLAARKRAKKDMAAATDPMEKAVQNGRQLALKISANSVYGFTGATVGQLPCVPIASSVTAYGRNLLLETRSFVESTYTIANGYPANAQVIYGDTDSVMVNFGVPSVAESMPLAQKAADEISAIFPRPIKLEFEKVYFPYLLMNKKRYAGLLWTNPEKYDKLDAKGLETVRRDNCLLVRRMVETCLKKILIERDVPGAISFAKGTIADLLQNKMDISMLVISKSLGKSADDSDYTAKQAHVELAMRMRKRDPGSAPNVGDRVAYVIIQGAKGAPAYEKSEDPVYVLDNNLPIDTEYYLTNQLSNPLMRIFEPIIPNPQSLLSGEHTRTVCKPTPTARAGGIMMFAVRKEKCLGCKVPIPAPVKSEEGDEGQESSPLCPSCRPKEADIYMSKLAEVNTHQQIFTKLWTECQRCQGSMHQEVICSNRDCSIFYKRKKVQIDLQSAQDALQKFSW